MNITLFENAEFGNVRTYTEDSGKVLFCGSDIAKALKYSNIPDAISRHCRCIVKHDIPHPQSPQKKISMLFITESDVYRLVAHSRLPSAERFESWIFDEVLPTIRRTGGYVGDADMFVENYLPFADEPIKQLFRLQMEVIGQLNDRIRHDEPLVEFANQVADTSNCIDVGTFAKLAFGEKSNFGRNNMFKWLKKRKFLTFHNIPYQKYIDAGYFVVKETFFIKNGEKKTYQQTLVTGKGQVYLMGKLREDFSIIDGNYLYNRCHLIAYELAAENANTLNLITGTRYLNIQGMLRFENKVADYVNYTGNHVLYRSTPIFEGDNLVASGVLMEGYSVEDAGQGIQYCVFCYNVQPGIGINYANGDSWLIEDTALEITEPYIAPAETSPPIQSEAAEQYDYVVNTNTKKFHYPSCSSVEDMKDKNRWDYSGSRDDLVAQGYVPCKRCNP